MGSHDVMVCKHVFIFSHFDWICCDGTEGVCMYVCASLWLCVCVCVCVAALRPKRMDKFWWNFLQGREEGGSFGFVYSVLNTVFQNMYDNNDNNNKASQYRNSKKNNNNKTVIAHLTRLLAEWRKHTFWCCWKCFKNAKTLQSDWQNIKQLI